MDLQAAQPGPGEKVSRKMAGDNCFKSTCDLPATIYASNAQWSFRGARTLEQ
jgi:hypothetical protein